MKKKLLISFSGGRTSGYMTWWLQNVWNERDEWDMVTVFANTGKEREETLEFVRDCDRYFGFKTIWVEGYPVESSRGKWWGVKHTVVDFNTASRNGEPFEAMISKLGLPSTNSPFCSDQLKASPIKSLLRDKNNTLPMFPMNWKGYWKAIGIRADEVDRMSDNFRKERIMYPLISTNPMNKQMILDWWGKQPFDLMVNSDLGNCDCCWKKDIKRLTRIANNQPKSFDWWQQMTDKYGHIQNTPASKKMKPPFNFYRGNISPKDIFKLSKLKQAQLELFSEKEKLDGCSETCEAF